MAVKLHEVSAEMNAFLEALNEVPDEDFMMSNYESIEWDFQQSMDNTLKYYFNLSADVDTVDSEIKRLTALKKSVTWRVNRTKSYINHCMNLSGQMKYQSTIWTVWYRKSESVIVTDEAIVPDDYKITETVTTTKLLSKPELKAAIKALPEWESIPWVEIQTKQNIQVK